MGEFIKIGKTEYRLDSVINLTESQFKKKYKFLHPSMIEHSYKEVQLLKPKKPKVEKFNRDSDKEEFKES